MKKLTNIIGSLAFSVISPLIFLALFVLFYEESVLFDPGIGWHLQTGELIITNLLPIYNDPFLFAPENINWVHDQWLGSVILYLIYFIGGFDLLIFIGALTIFLSFNLLKESNFHTKFSFLVLNLFMVLGILATSSAWVVRPSIISLFLFSTILFGLKKFRRSLFSYKSILFFSCIFILWTNIHGAWILGIVFFLFFNTIDLLLSKDKRDITYFCKLCLLVLFLLSLTMINPYGYQLHVSIYELLGSDYFMNLNEEWLAPKINDPSYSYFYILILPFLVSPFLFQRKYDVAFYVSSIFLLLLSFQSGRNIPFFALSVLAIAEDSGVTEFKIAKRFEYIFYLVIFSITLILISNKNEFEFQSRVPDELIEEIRKESTCHPYILNHPDWGGSLIYFFAGNLKFYIDDRNQVNPESKYKNYFNFLNTGDFQAMENHKKINGIILQKQTMAYQVIKSVPEWKLIKTEISKNYGEISLFCRN